MPARDLMKLGRGEHDMGWSQEREMTYEHYRKLQNTRKLLDPQMQYDGQQLYFQPPPIAHERSLQLLKNITSGVWPEELEYDDGELKTPRATSSPGSPNHVSSSSQQESHTEHKSQSQSNIQEDAVVIVVHSLSPTQHDSSAHHASHGSDDTDSSDSDVSDHTEPPPLPPAMVDSNPATKPQTNLEMQTLGIPSRHKSSRTPPAPTRRAPDPPSLTPQMLQSLDAGEGARSQHQHAQFLALPESDTHRNRSRSSSADGHGSQEVE